MDDFNVVVAHWAEAMTMYKQVYSKPVSDVSSALSLGATFAHNRHTESSCCSCLHLCRKQTNTSRKRKRKVCAPKLGQPNHTWHNIAVERLASTIAAFILATHPRRNDALLFSGYGETCTLYTHQFYNLSHCNTPYQLVQPLQRNTCWTKRMS